MPQPELQPRTAWPPLVTSPRGHLVIGGADALDLVERFGTPLYVLDEVAIRQRCRAYRDAMGDAGVIAYAAKALCTTAILRIMDQEGLWMDAVSGGELHTALAAGFPAGRVLLHGNNKSDEELRLAIETGVGRVVIDNFYELERLAAMARAAGRKVPVLLRVAPGVEAHTHEFIRTGQQESKFGFDLATGQALAALERVLDEPALDWYGFHCHIGSQILAVEPWEQAARIMMDLAAEAHRRTGRVMRELDLGGGLGIRYLPQDEPPSIAETVGRIRAAVAAAAEERGLPVPRLILEPGRSIVGEAGVTLYTVGAVKRVPGLAPYVAVDGGMADNPRYALYRALYTAVLANRPLDEPAERVCLVGRYCESGDILIPQIDLPRVEPGDVVAVFSTGAYNYSMSSQYNRFPRPAMVLVRDGEAEVIVERETYDDLLRHDRIPPSLAREG
ncbi:diaminopimelate decarboxylase [Thermaerobacter marianensis DSM 12885]|uniref:Diaminopimelate decarboxylase n=1 Tax=Thermaerobacter marianensis (strain ATCC 700841 / DSM 12885 / JCM 10246 / 7p75a) TaxID=644966 RepID=E6SHM2_THEM7|nr:diaminopimelate decarboxylase [Thermaerobacter marianensis]ADU51817.1 diaminopimelate decarboxylase [Thermaerobacter marianensis DSM 12885]